MHNWRLFLLGLLAVLQICASERLIVDGSRQRCERETPIRNLGYGHSLQKLELNYQHTKEDTRNKAIRHETRSGEERNIREFLANDRSSRLAAERVQNERRDESRIYRENTRIREQREENIRSRIDGSARTRAVRTRENLVRSESRSENRESSANRNYNVRQRGISEERDMRSRSMERRMTNSRNTLRTERNENQPRFSRTRELADSTRNIDIRDRVIDSSRRINTERRIPTERSRSEVRADRSDRARQSRNRMESERRDIRNVEILRSREMHEGRRLSNERRDFSLNERRVLRERQINIGNTRRVREETRTKRLRSSRNMDETRITRDSEPRSVRENTPNNDNAAERRDTRFHKQKTPVLNIRRDSRILREQRREFRSGKESRNNQRSRNSIRFESKDQERYNTRTDENNNGKKNKTVENQVSELTFGYWQTYVIYALQGLYLCNLMKKMICNKTEMKSR